MKVKTVEAYTTSDNIFFTCEDKAQAHQKDIIGTLLDELLPYDERGYMTRVDRFEILMKQLESKDLKKTINALHYALNF